MKRFKEYLNEMSVAETMRYEFDVATREGYTLGKEVPVTVTINRTSQKFLALQQKSGGSKLGVLYFKNLVYGTFLEGNPDTFFIRVYKIDSNNKLTQTDSYAISDTDAKNFAEKVDADINKIMDNKL